MSELSEWWEEVQQEPEVREMLEECREMEEALEECRRVYEIMNPPPITTTTDHTNYPRIGEEYGAVQED